MWEVRWCFAPILFEVCLLMISMGFVSYEVSLSFLFERLLVVGSSFLALGHCVVARAVKEFFVSLSQISSLVSGSIFESGESSLSEAPFSCLPRGKESPKIAKRSREPLQIPQHLYGFIFY